MPDKRSNDIIVYNCTRDVKIEVLTRDDTVWLNRQQLATLFGRDVKTIGKHIANALKEELKGMSTVAKFATVQKEGGRTITRQIEYYDLDVRQILRHASDSKLLKELEKRFSNHEIRLADVESAMKYVLNTLMPPIQKRRPIGFGAQSDD